MISLSAILVLGKTVFFSIINECIQYSSYALQKSSTSQNIAICSIEKTAFLFFEFVITLIITDSGGFFYLFFFELTLIESASFQSLQFLVWNL